MQDSRNGARPLKGYLLTLMAALCWASGGLTAKWLFTTPSAQTASWPMPPLGIVVSPTALSGGRALAAFVVLACYLVVRDRGAFAVSVRDLPFFALFGVGGLALVHFTYFKTISLTNVATAILLEYLAPIIVLIVSVLFLGHRFSWALPAGVALSVTGCAFVVGAVGGEGLSVSAEGIAWGLASAVFFAAYSLMGSWASGRFRPETLVLYGLAFATLFWLVSLGPGAVLELFTSVETAGAVLFMAVVSTVVPFSAFLVALNHIGPTNATVTSTIEPFAAGLGAFVLFGESLTLVQIFGGVLVIAAIVVVQLADRDSAEAMLPPPD